MNFDKIVDEIKKERKRQDEKWGSQRKLYPLKWLAILGEEVGEANKAILEHSLMEYQEELIQIAAVAIAAIEALDINGNDFLNKTKGQKKQ